MTAAPQTRTPKLLCTALTLCWCASTLVSCTDSSNTFYNAFQEILEPLFPQSPGEIAREVSRGLVSGEPDKARRGIALLSAAKWGGAEPYLALYRAAVTHPDDSIKAACLSALGRHGTVDDVPLIAQKLNHDPRRPKPTFVRWEAAKALQKIHNPAAIQPLITTARRDPDTDVRMAAASALAQYPTNAVYDALVGALNDREFGVRHKARQSLKTLTGYNHGPEAASWLAWGRENRSELFAQQQIYYWQPFEKPRGLIQKSQFWKENHPLQPRRPTGLDDPSDETANASNADEQSF